MAEYLVKDTSLTAIADAIRSKTGTTKALTLDEMAVAVDEIEIGGDTNNEEAIIARTIGTYTNSKITTIGSYAFAGCSKLTTVSFPAATSIKNNAFLRCSSLTAVSFPAVTSIEDYAFYDCYSLTTVNFPAATSIEDYAFGFCSNLTTVNFPVAKVISNYAFLRCSSLTAVSFPAVTSIGGNAFQSCYSLTTVNFPAATSIEVYAFQSCDSLTSVSFPQATTISNYAFYDCSSLTSVSFPVATRIGGYAFARCSSLTSVSFPQVTTISNSAFANCSSLTSVSFPQVTTIRNSAFANCSNLTSASFPVATSIGNSAFYKCYNLVSLFLMGSSLCRLAHSNAFSSTPIGGYSTSAKAYGSIYVPASLLTSYKTATNWTYFSSRFVGVGSSEEEEGGSGAPDLGDDTITFTIDDTEYQADTGMTWSEWVDSDYNTDSFWEDGGNVYNRYDYELKYNMNIVSHVSPSDEIIVDGLYVTASPGGSFP